MRIAIAADHAGYELKRDLAAALQAQGREVSDFGTDSPAPVDYPDCAESIAAALRDGRAARGIIVCRSGSRCGVSWRKVFRRGKAPPPARQDSGDRKPLRPVVGR